MGEIHFPPAKRFKNGATTECYVYGEPLTLHFHETGHFSHNNSHAFVPNLPAGNFVAPAKLGPYYSVANNNEITLTYFNLAKGEKYKSKITIKQTCPPKDGADL
jgi:hypothetical protein